MLQHHSMTIKTMEAVDATADTPIIVANEDAVRNAEEIGAVFKVVGKNWSNTLLLDSRHLCSYKQWMQDPGIRPQEGHSVVQQDVGERAELHLTGRVDTCN